jgi:hypothetical protein
LFSAVIASFTCAIGTYISHRLGDHHLTIRSADVLVPEYAIRSPAECETRRGQDPTAQRPDESQGF